MRICFAYNVKRKNPSLDISEEDQQEYDSPQVIKIIADTIASLGHTLVKLEADSNAFEKLKKLKKERKIDLVFTIAEGLHGDAREAQIPLFCEMLKIPYTHSTPTTHAIGLDKLYTKLLVKGNGVRVPFSQLISSSSDKINNEIRYPVIIKPNSEGSSVGIFNENVVEDKKHLEKRLKKLFVDGFFGQLLIEEFLLGREFTVSILGNNPPRILPVIEQRFDFLPKGFHKIAGYELKWMYEDNLKNPHDAYVCPAQIDRELQAEINKTSVLIYETLRIRDCARIDYRLGRDGKLYFLEVNTLPGLNFDPNVVSYFPASARSAGLGAKEVVEAIINSARSRWKI